MNWRVSIAFISDPLSDRAIRTGPSSALASGSPVLAEQALVRERLGEQQLHLRRGLLGGEQVADPGAGDDVDDRVGDPL
jgi:hypothetical protein